ncbi:right-handed parallel beta-helix repeat-containing protein [Bacteroides ihuae]|uniref:right-handed parallel beta-helix repeat-containing protein n=1 Tax=Bacteroides ihuae TaxID=1852362 RepID=UPI0008DACE18
MNKSIYMLLLLILSARVSATDIWVSPNGSDLAVGTKEAPKQTLTAALRQARELRRLQSKSIKGGVTIYMQGGNYSLYEPIFIRPEDSGTADSPTLIRSVEGQQAVLSGGVRISGWKKSKGNLWVADVPNFNGYPLDFRQLWVNGSKAVRARDVADFEQMARVINNDPVKQILWVPTKAIAKIRKAPFAEMVLHEMWCVANLRIQSIEVHGDSAAVRFHNPESRIQFEHPWPRPMVTTDGHNSAFYLTNAIELLDQPGEWYHDIRTNKLYYYPRKGEVMTSAEAVVPAIETLVQVEGTLDRPVQYIIFKNVAFRHTTWMRPSLKGHVPLQAGMYLTDGYQINPKIVRNYNNHELDNQGWLGRPAGAVQIIGGNHIDFNGCNFEQLGSTGLDYVYGAQGGKVEGCLFRDIAGNGLLAGSFSPVSLETHLPYDPADRREVCSHLTIANNYFTDVANEDWGCLAICAGYVSDINIEHNEICEVPYSGISLGWGWTQTVNCMRNNRIHANLIYHYAKHMYDVAGIYTLGSQPKSFVTENCVHSIYKPGYAHDPNHWFYLYTDEGSSFIAVKNNWTEGEKFLKNANGPGNEWENNGPMVNDSIKNRAGLEPEFIYLKKK